MENLLSDRLNLSNLPTPIYEINYKSHHFLIKRDDFTGLELSGNKARKIDFLIYDAMKHNADIVFTSGGIQSNHARATAYACAMCGLKSRLYLWGLPAKIPDGNLFLNSFIGADIKYIDHRQFLNNHLLMEKEKVLFEKRKKKKVYIIPEGGSNPLGILGYVNFMYELSAQYGINNLNGILAAAGSGGTAAGMLIGAELLETDIKIYAVNVLYEGKILYNKIQNIVQAALETYKLKCADPMRRLEIIEGFSEEGYKKIESSKVKLIRDFAAETGIVFDPVYTGKAFTAYYKKLKCDPKILFVHTGGMFGVFDKRKEYLFCN